VEDGTPGICRRRLLGGAVALAAVELAAAGCTEKPEASTSARPSSLSIPAADLAEGGRLTVMLGPNPVEIRRGPDGVTARMLRCTHTGCVVRWRLAEKVYVCPCHDGRFGADGRVISGPPPLPLRTVPVVLVADKLVVGA
jgi:cytochrome b6-f complex iron-sulfur subunit